MLMRGIGRVQLLVNRLVYVMVGWMVHVCMWVYWMVWMLSLDNLWVLMMGCKMV